MQDLFRQLGKLLAENGLGTPGQESVDVSSLLPSPGAIFGGATKVASSLFEAVTIAAAVLFLGTFFAWEPEVYKAALLSILPADRRQRVDQVLDQAAHAMREWMLGQSVSMAVIFLFSLAALLLVQMPYPILLAVQAGLLGFIPTIGPFIAGVVIILAGLSQSHHRPLRPGNLCGVPISRIALGHPDGAGTHDPAAARFYPRNTAHCGSPVWAPRGGISVPLAAAGKVLIEEFYVKDRLGGLGGRAEAAPLFPCFQRSGALCSMRSEEPNLWPAVDLRQYPTTKSRLAVRNQRPNDSESTC
jgi:hypothetical protein